MAKKITKQVKSKGERLGWTPLDQVKSVILSSVVVKGRRVTSPRYRAKGDVQSPVTVSLLIP